MSAEVHDVSLPYFVLQTALENNIHALPQGSWHEFTDGSPVMHDPAGQDLIVYAVDSSTNTVIAGDFSEADPERMNDLDARKLYGDTAWARRMRLPDGIAVPKPELIPRLNSYPFDSDYREFRSFIDRVGEMVKISGPDAVDVYMFGQNLPVTPGGDDEDRMGELTRTVREFFRIKALFTEAGVQLANIHDFREAGTDGEDRTMILPRTGVIYHYRRQIEEKPVKV